MHTAEIACPHPELELPAATVVHYQSAPPLSRSVIHKQMMLAALLLTQSIRACNALHQPDCYALHDQYVCFL